MRDQTFEDESQIPSEILHDLGKGVLAGFAATIVVSILVILQNAFSFVPQFDLIGMVGGLVGTASRSLAWGAHFLVGAVVLGAMFAGLDSHVEHSNLSG